MSQDYRDQYQKTDPTEPFKTVLRDYVHCFKTIPEGPYLKKFCEYAKDYARYPDVFRRAMQQLVETQGSFPTIPELKATVEKLPARPIDHVAANHSDPRIKRGCSKCDFRGYLLAKDAKDYETVCVCNHCRGKGLTTILPTREEVAKHGYTKIKERRS